MPRVLDVGGEISGELERVDCGWHHYNLDVLLIRLVQDLFQGDESEIHLQRSFMHLIKNYMSVIDLLVEQKLLDEDTVGHEEDLGFWRKAGLHADLISYFGP